MAVSNFPPSLLGPEIGLGILVGPVKSPSVLFFFGSGSFHERSEGPAKGFLKASASKMRFGPHFGCIFGSGKRAVDLKNQGNPMESMPSLWFSHFQLASVWEQVITPSGTLF